MGIILSDIIWILLSDIISYIMDIYSSYIMDIIIWCYYQISYFYSSWLLFSWIFTSKSRPEKKVSVYDTNQQRRKWFDFDKVLSLTSMGNRYQPFVGNLNNKYGGLYTWFIWEYMGFYVVYMGIWRLYGDYMVIILWLYGNIWDYMLL